ncbi:hypothetical protein [Mesorhizobium sp.]|uniref:hypothetical protein n=1 Tax=Mesorhizobium sp. TaxID=1871066 RepID=UPI0025D5FFCC|nr:hypothetical protein [Mesorhizobium sp.]
MSATCSSQMNAETSSRPPDMRPINCDTLYVDDEEDIGHFVNEKVQILPGIKDTFTLVTFRAF